MKGLAASAKSAAWLAISVDPFSTLMVVALGALSGLSAAPSAWLTKKLLDALGSGQSSEGWVIFLAVSATLMAAAVSAFAYTAGRFEAGLVGSVQAATQTRLARACASYEGTSFGDDPEIQAQLNLARRGAHEAPSALANLLITVVSGVAAISSFAIVLARVWPWMLALVALTSVPMASMQVVASKRMFAATEESAAHYRWSDYLTGLFADPPAAREMRLFDSTESLLNLHERHLRLAICSEVRQSRRSASLQSVYTLTSGAVAAVGAGIVATSVFDGMATPGDFVLFTASVVAIQRVLVGLVSVTGSATVAATVYKRFDEFVVASRANTASLPIAVAPPLTDAIEYRDVSFTYPGASRPALQHFTARFEIGESYALLGPNGSGKTTVTRLLMRFYEPDSGQITWDGVDVRTYSARSLRRHITGVLQDFGRYELPVLDNVLMCPGREAEPAKAMSALDSVSLGDLVRQFPEGLNTLLSTTRMSEDGFHGSTLSGGQWQRLAISRAIVRSPVDVMLLDEPDAALDTKGALAMSQLLVASRAAKLTIFITHRIVDAESVSRVLYMRSGQVVPGHRIDEGTA